MYDNTIISKYDTTEKDKEIKNKFYESKPSSKNSTLIQNEELNNPFSKNLASSNVSGFNENRKNPLLKQTKNSVKELIQYNTNFQNAKKSSVEKIDEIEVQKILSPVYDKVDEIKKEIKKINNNISNNNNNNNNLDDDIFKAHNYLEKNKTNIEDTLTYMKENIANINYEQIGKDIIDLTSMLENLNNEMEKMTNEFNEKFELIIKEKRRQKIADDLLSGKYNENTNSSKYFPNEKSYTPSNNLEKIDYNEYKNDLDNINYEKEDLLLRYQKERKDFERDLPKLMKPSEKTYFSYDINEDKKTGKEKSKKSKSKKSKNKNILYDNKTNQSKQKKTNQQIEPNKYTNNKLDKNKLDNNNIENESEENEKEEEEKLSPLERMSKYQEKMSNLANEIQSKKSRLSSKEKKVIKVGPSKKDIIRTMQPRSLNSKKTLQDFKRTKLNPVYEYEEEKREPNNFRQGKYPSIIEENNLRINYYNKKPNIYPEYNRNKTNIEINYNDYDEEELNNEIRKNIELYIRNALRGKKPDLYNEKNIKINIEEKNKKSTNEDLMKILIQKFDELQRAIVGGGINYNYDNIDNNVNLNQSGRNINDIIADQILQQLGVEVDVNIDKDNISNRNIPNDMNYSNNQSHRSIKISERKKREIEKEKEEGKKEGKKIPLFEKEDKLSINELDQLFQMPHKINLSEYNVSSSSSYLSESLNQKNYNLKEMLEIHERNIYSNEKEDSINSISKGQAISEDNEYDNSSFIKKNNINKGNEYNIRNRTGLDLLMLKNYNERIPQQILGNISGINDNNDYSVSESFKDDNQEVVDINDNNRLRQLGLYQSEEFRNFENNLNQFNNNNKQ